MKRRLSGLIVVVFTLVAALIGSVPLSAAGTAATSMPAAKKVTTLSTASIHLLHAPEQAVRAQADQAPAPGAGGGNFFRTRKGALALVLIGVGVGAAWYAHKDSRDKVKSPIR